MLTQWRRWGSNPWSLGLESSTLPLSHCAPISRHEAAKMMNPECPAEYSRDMWFPKLWHFYKCILRPAWTDPFKLRNSNWCLDSQRIFKRLAVALIRQRICAGWSEPLLAARTTLLEISLRTHMYATDFIQTYSPTFFEYCHKTSRTF